MWLCFWLDFLAVQLSKEAFTGIKPSISWETQRLKQFMTTENTDAYKTLNVSTVLVPTLDIPSVDDVDDSSN